jgi:hypothetical protein
MLVFGGAFLGLRSFYMVETYISCRDHSAKHFEHNSVFLGNVDQDIVHLQFWQSWSYCIADGPLEKITGDSLPNVLLSFYQPQEHCLIAASKKLSTS